MINAQPSLSYITWGRETGEYLQVFRDHGGEVSVEWILENEDGGRDLIDFLPADDGTLRETHREPNTTRAPPYERPYYVAAKEVVASTWPDTYIFLGSAG